MPDRPHALDKLHNTTQALALLEETDATIRSDYQDDPDLIAAWNQLLACTLTRASRNVSEAAAKIGGL